MAFLAVNLPGNHRPVPSAHSRTACELLVASVADWEAAPGPEARSAVVEPEQAAGSRPSSVRSTQNRRSAWPKAVPELSERSAEPVRAVTGYRPMYSARTAQCRCQGYRPHRTSGQISPLWCHPATADDRTSRRSLQGSLLRGTHPTRRPSRSYVWACGPEQTSDLPAETAPPVRDTASRGHRSTSAGQ